MNCHRKYLTIAAIAALVAAQPAEARRAYHHSLGHHSSHSYRVHHAARAHSYVGHLAHYTVDYAVHYSIRRSVRSALWPSHPREPHETTPAAPAPAAAMSPGWSLTT
jgi:hypothetical protein